MAALETYPEPDPGRFPVWPVGTWERALICQCAGVPTDPDSAAALGRHDAHRRDQGVMARYRAAAEYDRALRAATYPVIQAVDGPVELDLFCLAVAEAPGWEDRGQAVADAILGQHPLASGERGRGTSTPSTRRVWTGSAHLVVTCVRHIHAWTDGTLDYDPLDPPASVLEAVTSAAASITPPEPGAPPVTRPRAVAPAPRPPSRPFRPTGVTLTPEERATGRARAVELRGEGWSMLRIAQAVGVDRSTVRRWLREAEDAAA